MVKVKIQYRRISQQLAGAGNRLSGDPKALEAGRVALGKMKSNLRAAIGRGTKYESRSTGKLVAALDLPGS